MENYVLKMVNVCKYFAGVRANYNVNLQVRKGEVHALLGENGAGKSTLMNVLYGLYRPTSGEIYLDGKLKSRLQAKPLAWGSEWFTSILCLFPPSVSLKT